MTRLYRSLIAVIIGLALFFNIERLDFGNENFIDIATFVYIQGVFLVLTMLVVPPLRQWSIKALIALWLSIYLVCKLYLSESNTLFGGFYTYLTITEMTMLVGLIWLTHRMNTHLEEFRKVVEYVTYSDTNQRIHQRHEAIDIIDTELFRSRRHQRPLSVVIVKPHVASMQHQLSPIVQEIQQSMMTRFIMSGIGRRISMKLRRTDLIIEELKPGRFILLCPETDINEASVVLDRVAEATEELDIPFSCSVSSFPDDALTFEALVRNAEEKLDALAIHRRLYPFREN